ncbi:thermonuclease family protein [Candidatus Microgenomates bacterium]|nr:thermonuclease family protein [Candidatus Microgenomates bacterium]
MKKKKNKLIKWLGPLILLASLIVNFFLAGKIVSPHKTEPKGDLVIEVLDGDTFVLPGKQRVRLKRVEAPELENCGGSEAKKRLEELVLGKEVILKNIIVDQFRRIVALVYVDHLLINEVMLKEGQLMYLGGVTEEEKNLRQAAEYARERKLGVYSEKCSPTKPPNEKCLIKGNVGQDSGGKIYHFPGCSAYNKVEVQRSWGDQWFCSEEEAQKAGFTKSKNCYGKKYSPL